MRPSPILQKALKRLPLTTKNGPHNYYKGNRTGSMGKHTKYGGYIVDFKKVRTYVCPNLDGFQLTPFVDKKIKRFGGHGESITAQEYLQAWKDDGGRI